MLVQKIGTLGFTGHKEINAIGTKYGKGEKDAQLINDAHEITNFQVHSASDEDYFNAGQKEAITKFVDDAVKSENPRLAFHLLADIAKLKFITRNTENAGYVTRCGLQDVARDSSVTKEDVLNNLEYMA